jgi:hypothetical protein
MEPARPQERAGRLRRAINFVENSKHRRNGWKDVETDQHPPPQSRHVLLPAVPSLEVAKKSSPPSFSSQTSLSDKYNVSRGDSATAQRCSLSELCRRSPFRFDVRGDPPPARFFPTSNYRLSLRLLSVVSTSLSAATAMDGTSSSTAANMRLRCSFVLASFAVFSTSRREARLAFSRLKLTTTLDGALPSQHSTLPPHLVKSSVSSVNATRSSSPSSLFPSFSSLDSALLHFVTF